ncbi:MAG: hypothetical protein MUC36_12475 [Planctomycetes bacterium]|jgi:hypothetical protein|nr:hypothetical protein [Planctomycetota bacterium]
MKKLAAVGWWSLLALGAVRAQDALRTQVPVPGTVQLTVRDRATGEVVPAAEVWWLERRRGESDEELADARRDPEPPVRAGGQRSLTAADGRVELTIERWARVVARAGERYGECFVRRSEASAELAMDVDTALRVRTVDGEGRPVAGVRVALTAVWRRAGVDVPPWSTLLLPSDADGLAELPHAQLLGNGRLGVRLARPELDGAVLHTLSLQPQLTGGDGATVVHVLDHERLPGAPIPVPVPPTGSLELMLRGPDGAAWPLVPGDRLQAVLRPDDRPVRSLQRQIHTVPWAADGSARFERVLVGATLELLGRTDWYAGRHFSGPQRAGEVMRVEVPIEPGSCWLQGRLVREDGSPWPHGGELRRGSQQQLPADSGGRFLVPVDNSPNDPRVFVHAGDLATELVLQAEPGPGRNQVGDVVLKPLPLLVAGRVVVRGAAEPKALLASLRVHVSSWPAGQAFGRATRQQVTLDGEGRFEVHGLADETDYRVVVDGNVTGERARSFAPGARDVVLEVAAAVQLEVGFLVAPEWNSLVVSLLRNDAPGTAVASTVFGAAAAGRQRFSAEGLVDGEYRLIAAVGWLTLVERRITIVGGQVQDAAALAAIDLRGIAPQIVVRVTDPAGVPCQDTSIAWRPVGADDTRWSVDRYGDRGGRGTMLVVPGAVELAVWAPGHELVEQPAVAGDVGLVLRPLPRLLLQWPAAASLPPGTTVALLWQRDGERADVGELRPELRAAAMVAAARRGGELPTQLRDGKVTLSAANGSRLRLRLQLRGARTAAPIAVQPGALDAGTWRDGDLVELQVDAGQLEVALRQCAPAGSGR